MKTQAAICWPGLAWPLSVELVTGIEPAVSLGIVPPASVDPPECWSTVP